MVRITIGTGNRIVDNGQWRRAASPATGSRWNSWSVEETTITRRKVSNTQLFAKQEVDCVY